MILTFARTYCLAAAAAAAAAVAVAVAVAAAAAVAVAAAVAAAVAVDELLAWYCRKIVSCVLENNQGKATVDSFIALLGRLLES
jgi:hypothetical protein